MLLACLPNPVRAALTCQHNGNTLTRGHATSFITPSDNLPIGTPVSGWNQYRVMFRCQVTAGSTSWKVRERAVPTAFATGLTWNATLSNSTAAVHTSNELQALGLGWAGAWFLTTDSISYFDNGYDISIQDNGVACPQFGEPLPVADGNGDVHLGIIINPAACATIASPTITFAKRTCTTPSWPTIPLPMITTNGFLDEANGIIKPDPGSVAQGIGGKVQTRMRPHPVYLWAAAGVRLRPRMSRSNSARPTATTCATTLSWVPPFKTR